jgi:predicted nucleic acid-binding Zn ribbon protein
VSCPPGRETADPRGSVDSAVMGWRPLPGDDRRPPVHVSNTVERVLRHLGAPSASALETVFGQWEALVGERVAAHAEPVAVADGRLTVRAEDPAWASQLRWLERDLVHRLSAALGPGVVTAIDVRVGTEQRVARLRSGRVRRR